ncbi:type IV toxin-antitoxin system AbiEi family antitoxin domain-containing protein [Gordonia soli]|uniref:DUF559 domain-containing protein n=1 Tax=Gordonia soli NBRC 108243 TaxID=1223545 RepID=M0QLT5_9ACTN|nr:type IV toxin-antitoxin system AbiEi family antitoxin domain-containing protein [Gordonia soli]GAC69271.1 hypothetical protein GS4_23_00680 [Gordonia soli NBRC 108243]
MDGRYQQFGGVVSAAQLVAWGETRADIRRAVRSGFLRRLRHGWFMVEGADPVIVAVVSAGAVLTCASALAEQGIWVPDVSLRQVHSRVTRHGGRVAEAAPLDMGCRAYGEIPPSVGAVDAVDIALLHAARCLDDESLVVVCDSILNKRVMTREQIETVLRAAPQRIGDLLARCDERAQSGTETMARVRLRALGLPVIVQHHVVGVGFVDLLIGDRLIIEVDSIEHHTDSDAYERDRRRDRELARLGYIVIRLTYAQVTRNWSAAENDIIDMVRRRMHRWPRSRVA